MHAYHIGISVGVGGGTILHRQTGMEWNEIEWKINTVEVNFLLFFLFM